MPQLKATFAVEIRVDMAEVERLIAAGHREYRKAAARALNRSVSKVRTAVVRAIADRRAIKPARLIRKRLRMKRARERVLSAGLRFLGTPPVPVASMTGVRDTGRGGWKRRRGQGVTAPGGRAYRHAFLTIGKGNNMVVLERRDLGNPRSKMFAHKVDLQGTAEEVIADKIGEAHRHFSEEFPSELKYRMTGRR